MGSETESVRRDATPGNMRSVRIMDDPRVPWWANWIMKAIMVLGIPGALLGFREYKDFRYEGERLKVENGRVEAEQRQNIIMERFEKVLYRVERKLPDENK